jgi:hypothetical protein
MSGTGNMIIALQHYAVKEWMKFVLVKVKAVDTA